MLAQYEKRLWIILNRLHCQPHWQKIESDYWVLLFVVVVSIENYACLTKRGLSILIKTTLFLFERIGPTGEKLLCKWFLCIVNSWMELYYDVGVEFAAELYDFLTEDVVKYVSFVCVVPLMVIWFCNTWCILFLL